MNHSLFRTLSPVSQNQLRARVVSAVSQCTPILYYKQGSRFNDQKAPLTSESCYFVLLLISAGVGPLPAAREFALWHFLSASSHTAPALPCSVCFWQPTYLFWVLEIWAVSYLCWKWSLHFCFPFSLLLLDVLQQEKGDTLTAWTTFRPQAPPLHFYTSISSTVKDP